MTETVKPMKCSAAMKLVNAGRDDALDELQRVNLQEHLARCPECSQIKLKLTAVVDSWRATVTQARVPDAAIEWQRIRRRLPSTTSQTKRRQFRPILLAWLSVPLTAAAGVLLAFVVPHGGEAGQVPTPQEAAHADFVEVGNDSTSVVFVDAKSGWLVVWADKPGSG